MKRQRCGRAGVLASAIELLVFLVLGMAPNFLRAQPKKLPASAQDSEGCPIVFVGFVGAMEPSGGGYSGVVKLREALQNPQFADVCARTYTPYSWREARNWLLSFEANRAVTQAEAQEAPKIILEGHSMGGWAVLCLAHDLQRRGIPVELAVLVAGVEITDHTIPSNVKTAAIFYASDPLGLITTKKARVQDAAATVLLADKGVKHVNHWSVTRDPEIRELVIRSIKRLREQQAGR